MKKGLGNGYIFTTSKAESGLLKETTFCKS